MAACGQTIAHLPQSMHRSGSQIGISAAMVRFSYCDGAGGEGAVDRQRAHRQQVALAGDHPRGDPLRRSRGRRSRHRRRDGGRVAVAAAGTGTSCRFGRAASTAATLRSHDDVAALAVGSAHGLASARAMASSCGSTPDSAKKQACITVLMRPPRPAARATAAASIGAQVEALRQDLLLHLDGQAVPHLVGGVRAVDQHGGAGRGQPQHVELLQAAPLVHADERGLGRSGRCCRSGSSSKRRWLTVIEPDFFES